MLKQQSRNSLSCHHVCFGESNQGYLQEGCTAVTDDAIPLHFSKAQATISGSSFYRLPCQHGHRPPSSRVNLVIHHVLEALVVGWVQEDLGFELTTGMTVVHLLRHSALIPNSAEVHKLCTCCDCSRL